MLIAVLEKEHQAESNPLRIRLRNLIRRMKSAAFCGIPGSGAGSRFYPRALLNDENFSPRATALLLLASDKSADVRALIEQAFVDDDWSMRAAAVQLIARPQYALWRTRLLPALHDTNKKVRFRAAAVYLRFSR